MNLVPDSREAVWGRPVASRATFAPIGQAGPSARLDTRLHLVEMESQACSGHREPLIGVCGVDRADSVGNGLPVEHSGLPAGLKVDIGPRHRPRLERVAVSGPLVLGQLDQRRSGPCQRVVVGRRAIFQEGRGHLIGGIGGDQRRGVPEHSADALLYRVATYDLRRERALQALYVSVVPEPVAGLPEDDLRGGKPAVAVHPRTLGIAPSDRHGEATKVEAL